MTGTSSHLGGPVPPGRQWQTSPGGLSGLGDSLGQGAGTVVIVISWPCVCAPPTCFRASELHADYQTPCVHSLDTNRDASFLQACQSFPFPIDGAYVAGLSPSRHRHDNRWCSNSNPNHPKETQKTGKGGALPLNPPKCPLEAHQECGQDHILQTVYLICYMR